LSFEETIVQRTVSPSPLTLAAATFIGSAIEWYDFFIYGTAAALIFNRLFFPEFDPLVGTIATLASLATGYVGRPVGGALPAMWLIEVRQVGLLTLGLLLAMIGPAIMFGPQASFFAELFGARVRYTGTSCGFQLGAVAGGVAPIVAAAVVAATSNVMAVGLVLLALGLISTFSALAAGRPWSRSTTVSEAAAPLAA